MKNDLAVFNGFSMYSLMSEEAPRITKEKIADEVLTRAKMEPIVKDLKEFIASAVKGSENTITKKILRLDAKIEATQHFVEKMEKRLDAKIDGVEKRLVNVEKKNVGGSEIYAFYSFSIFQSLYLAMRKSCFAYSPPVTRLNRLFPTVSSLVAGFDETAAISSITMVISFNSPSFSTVTGTKTRIPKSNIKSSVSYSVTSWEAHDRNNIQADHLLPVNSLMAKPKVNPNPVLTSLNVSLYSEVHVFGLPSA